MEAAMRVSEVARSRFPLAMLRGLGLLLVAVAAAWAVVRARRLRAARRAPSGVVAASAAPAVPLAPEPCTSVPASRRRAPRLRVRRGTAALALVALTALGLG